MFKLWKLTNNRNENDRCVTTLQGHRLGVRSLIQIPSFFYNQLFSGIAA